MYSTFGLSLPPMGLMYLAAVLERQGHYVSLCDLTVSGDKPDQYFFAEADLVGISTDTTRIDKAMLLAKKAKKAGKFVVFGGPHPQFMAEEILCSGVVDCIVKGEGEAVLPLLLDAMVKQIDFSELPGVMYMKGNILVETASLPPVNIENLPFPARHLLDLSLYSSVVDGRPAASILSSRGCPGACHFCSSSSFFGRGWRARSAESVLAEIDELYNRYNYRAVAFMDDNFTLNPERVIQICDGIIERGYDLKFWNFSRIDTIVNNPTMVAKMALAGSKIVYLGIESDNKETLNSLGKRSSILDVEKAINLLRKNNIEIYGSFIIGNINESASDVNKTITMAIKLDTNIAQFSILTPYPGTVLYHKLKDRIFTKKWKFFDGLHLVFKHPHINRHHLQLLLVRAYISFYRRSNQSINGFKSATSRLEFSFGKLVRCAWELFI